MEIKKLIVGQLQTNCYVVWGKDHKAVIIDPGDDAEYIENTIRDLGLEPRIILATHGHYDHLLAVTELKLAYRIPWAIHRADLPLVFRSRQIKPDRFLQDEEIVDGFRVVHFDEHSPGSIGFYHSGEKVIFSGDILFAQGVGTHVTKKSLDKILQLPMETMVYPGHEESFILAEWREGEAV